MTHILYHANCADGFGAALAAWLKFGDGASYLPVRHGDAMPEIPSGSRVAIVDFSFPRQQLIELERRCSELLVLDHHKSAQADLEGLSFARFDMDRSGARLAWEHWHPGTPLPDLLAYVEDRDLWRWALPDSREVSAALACYPLDFAVWRDLQTDLLKQEGRAIFRYQQTLIERASSRARLVEIAGHLVPVVNSCMLQSEIGDELCRVHFEAPFSGVYSVKSDGRQAWSLRSHGEFDVSAIAAQFGGGGHRNASGFAMEVGQHLGN